MLDYNDADQQNEFDIIPKGTVAPVRMTIRPGNYIDNVRGWTDGYPKRGATDAIYLDCEFVVTGGQYAKRKIFSLIGLYSPKGPDWGNIGRSFIRAILNSARGVSDKDNSQRAIDARKISSFADLNGIEFLARIDVEIDDRKGTQKNVIKFAVTPDHPEYGSAAVPAPAPQPTTQAAPTQSYQPQQQQPQAFARPAWAQ